MPLVLTLTDISVEILLRVFCIHSVQVSSRRNKSNVTATPHDVCKYEPFFCRLKGAEPSLKRNDNYVTLPAVRQATRDLYF